MFSNIHGLFIGYIFGGTVRLFIDVLAVSNIQDISRVFLAYYLPPFSVSSFVHCAILNIIFGIPAMGLLWAKGMIRFHYFNF
jgi:hypothetical protein